MNPPAMGLILVITLGIFAYSAYKRWKLLKIGTPVIRTDQIAERVKLTFKYAIKQKRMTRYNPAGLAHQVIFIGFLVLLLRSLILFGRGFVDNPDFGYWLFNDGTILGNIYALIKDVYILLVIGGTLVFVYLRVVKRLPRMTLSREGLVILLIILVMMVGDIVYDGAGLVLDARNAAAVAVNATPAAAEGGIIASSTIQTVHQFNMFEPLGSIIGYSFDPLSDSVVKGLWHTGYWAHVCLVLIFLNLLPYSKHFHVITAIPNVFCQNLTPKGRLVPIEDLEGRVDREETLGIRYINQLSWKGLLDLYTCTECGRCTDQCPAFNTGKKLSPKKFTTDLRDYLYKNEKILVSNKTENGNSDGSGNQTNLVPGVIDTDVLWACTTCGACEKECPVFISYIDKIVDLRRYMVQEQGEFPEPLQEAFQNIEVTGNPYGVSCDDRMDWTEGIDVRSMAEVDDPEEIEFLLWVGCAPSIDDKAKNITRAVARLLNHAGVKWAVLGIEEMCTGDVARRAGNEFLFQTMAQTNIELLNGYKVKKIITACPHCYNTLKHEYPDFGGKYEVKHHTEFLFQLVNERKIKPENTVEAKVVYHDSCYLGRYNDMYDSPRDILEVIPGVDVLEVKNASFDRGMCCGAGGGQMFKEEEEGSNRVNLVRTQQLVDTGADIVCTACPFCMRMLSDGLNLKDITEVKQQDVAEILWQAVKTPDE